SCRRPWTTGRSRRWSAGHSGSGRSLTRRGRSLATHSPPAAPPMRQRASRRSSPVGPPPGTDGTGQAQRAGWPRCPGPLHAVRQFAVQHASSRSVWFRNSIRGAAGLAIAVFIAQRADLQHSFWVVLGTLSVLRSNALGTGRSIVSALAGTAAGIVVGAAILLALGGSDPVLWGVLPVAVLVAAY